MKTMLLDENQSIFQGEYSFLGVVLSALILLSIFTLIMIYWVLPKLKNGAKFNVAGQLGKLDKPTYKRIKKMYFENFRRRKYIENLIVSNYGIFIINARFETGKITKNEHGKFVAEKDGAIRVLGDYERENQNTAAAIKRLSKIFDGVNIYSLVVFPDSAKIEVQSNDGFFGNLKDMTAYIKNNSQTDFGSQKRDEMYSVLCKENSKNQQ